MRRTVAGTWRNWAGSQVATPAHLLTPGSEDEVAAAVATAADEGLTVRMVGAGHSFTDVAVTDGVLLRPSGLSGLRRADVTNGLVTVGGGTHLYDLHGILDDLGLALPNLGDIDRQTVAGAISTGTHGTGWDRHSIAAAVAGLRIVTGDGSIVELGDDDTDALQAGVVGVGALGVITEVTLRCVPAFRLRATEGTARLDSLLEDPDGFFQGADHVEAMWVPHTPVILTKHNEITDDPPDSTWARRRRSAERELTENLGFGAIVRAARRWPSLWPKLATALPDLGSSTWTAPSYEVFCSRRRVKFLESEWGVPYEALPSVMREVRALVDRLPHPVTFPVELRVVDGDDVAMSMAYGRRTAFVAVHAYVGTPYEGYFAGVEAIMRDHEGRPHWGKLHRMRAADLRLRYPLVDRFDALRARLDPDGRFHTPAIERTLGPAVPAVVAAP